MTTRSIIFTFIGVTTVTALACSGVGSTPGGSGLAKAIGPRRKIIEYGHDVPEPAFVRAHVKEMEKRPFDGVVMRLPKYQQMFDTKPWPEADLLPEAEALAATKWERFTDNFLFLNGTKVGMQDVPADWFNDSHWNTIAANMKLFSRVIRDGKLKGICWDAEPYKEAGENIWLYPGSYTGDAVAKLPAQARERGRQIMKALQAETPVMKILTFHQLARLLYQMGGNDQLWIDWKTPPDVAGQAHFHHQGHKYALLGEFFVGMLEVAGPGVTFIDGNEHAYYYSGRAEFERARKLIREDALSLVPPELRQKYSQQVQVGVATYTGWIMGTWPREKLGLTPPHFMSTWEQYRYMEADIYDALATTDEYVWFYNEDMDWWRKPGDAITPSNNDVPPVPLGAHRPYKISPTPEALEQAIISARAKYDAGQPLGYDLAPMIKAAKEKQAIEMKATSKVRDGKTAD